MKEVEGKRERPDMYQKGGKIKANWYMLQPKHEGSRKKNEGSRVRMRVVMELHKCMVPVGTPIKKQGYLMSKNSTTMDKENLSLVMDTVSIIGMFLIAGVLLCI